MKKEFWIEKWHNKQTGFHKDSVHPLLINYIKETGIKSGDTVFVPLCGKSLDMLWLNNQGYKVIGNELSQFAVEQFFAENNLNYDKHNMGDFVVYTHDNITIFQDDFFELLPEHTADVKAVYDRAAFIALPDGMVQRYVKHMTKIIPTDAKHLLITLEFVKSTGSIGPPFNSPDSKVKDLYGQYSSIHLLQEDDIISKEQKFKQQGCNYVYERVYLIQK